VPAVYPRLLIVPTQYSNVLFATSLQMTATLRSWPVASHVRLLCSLALLLSFALGTSGAARAATVPDAVTFAISDDAAQRAFPSELTTARGIGISSGGVSMGTTTGAAVTAGAFCRFS